MENNKMQKKLLLITIIFGLNYIHAQKPKLENTLLWEVSGKELRTPSYLFGTIHMLCEADYLVKPKVQAAFEKSKTLTVEINMLDSLEMANMQKVMFSKTKMSEILNKRDAFELDSILQKQFNYNLKMLDNFKPVGLISLMLMKAVGCSNIKMLDMEFMKSAKTKGLKINNLETIIGQMDMLEKATPINEIVNQMKIGNEYTPLFAKMVEYYKSENIMELDKLLKDRRFMNVEAEKIMLNNRNLDWVEKIPSIMASGSSFMAFGAAHLPGDFGIINLLRKKGYIVKPILD
jgi:uncharacterized protein YbaP (TraB family)